MTAPFYADDTVTVHHGDCLDVLATLPDASVDAVVTDPPYGLEFMGKEWDSFKATGRFPGGGPTTTPAGAEWAASHGKVSQGFDGMPSIPRFTAGRPFQAWCESWATECLRVLKPGGHLLAFGGTRTSHRLACAIEDAGFEIRDSIAWLYGSGFPKSRDVSKAIDSEAGAEREVVGHAVSPWHPSGKGDVLEVARTGDTRPTNEAGYQVRAVTAPATDAARTWQGWGTALKPAHEPVVVARKPLAGTVAGNVLAHGTGALNVDGCRVEGRVGDYDHPGNDNRTPRGVIYGAAESSGKQVEPHASGRWPANVVLDESQAAALDQMSGESVSNVRTPTGRDTRGIPNTESQAVTRFHDTVERGVSDSGGASRFFYTAKADAIEREADYLPLILQRIHRRRDPVAAVLSAATDAEDLGLFGLLEEGI